MHYEESVASVPILLFDVLLAYFPRRTHALTLVSDPAGLLQQPALRTRLEDAGFRLVAAGDPIVLRQAWYAAQPLTTEQPLIVATDGPTNLLPYDLWQQGVMVDLSLARFFPQLDGALPAGLALAQLDRLYQALTAQPPPAALGRTASLDYVLLHVFGAAPAQLGAPGPLLGWLVELHSRSEPLPAPLTDELLRQLQHRPALAGWPLAELLADRAAFQQFAQAQWQANLRQIGETQAAYTALIPFRSDPAVQALLPVLVNCGLLKPVAVEERAAFPVWSHVALHEDAAAAHLRRWNMAVRAVEQLLGANPTTWEDWQAAAQAWAELTRLRYSVGGLPDPAGAGRYTSLAGRLAPVYTAWLHAHYGGLAKRRLPIPHHLHHIPEVLHQSVLEGRRVALIVLDGMSLGTWRTIWDAWALRHPAWRAQETLLLAQIPTITAISRQALLAGCPPRDFAASLTHNQKEETHWRNFWQKRNLPAVAAAYTVIPSRQTRPLPTQMDSLHTRALAVVLPDVDEMVHGARTGLAGLYAELNVWLNHEQDNNGSRWLEALIENLLAHDYRVTLTSDHGHVEALGIGQPQEGVAVTTRSKRARIYHNEGIARSVQHAFSQTTLWQDDGLLPPNTWVLMPDYDGAFAPFGQCVVSHGGITLDETIVPFITIEQEHG